MNSKKIGILGGIGPEATGEFYNRLIRRLQEKRLIKSNRDFPQIIINSIPAPELIYDTISDEELQPYIDGLKELHMFGVDFIVIVCNTIHLYYDKLQKEISTPIIYLRDELKELLRRKQIKSTFIIGTSNTIKKGLYRFKDIASFEPNKKETKQLKACIFNFNKGIEKQKQIEKVRMVCENHLREGVETIILGCTELAVMLGNEKFSTINTIDVLVEATIREFSSEYINAS